MRLIDADALEREYRGQFDSVYKNIRDSVSPANFYLERKASYDKKLVKLEMEAFFEYLHNRPTIDAVPVVRCKDCIHAVDITNLTVANRCGMEQKNCMRQRGDDGFGFAGVSVVYPDGFCDEGEKSDD